MRLDDRQLAALSTALQNPMVVFPKKKGVGGAQQQPGLTNPQDPNAGFPSAHTGKETPKTASDAKGGDR